MTKEDPKDKGQIMDEADQHAIVSTLLSGAESILLNKEDDMWTARIVDGKSGKLLGVSRPCETRHEAVLQALGDREHREETEENGEE